MEQFKLVRMLAMVRLAADFNKEGARNNVHTYLAAIEEMLCRELNIKTTIPDKLEN